jgi:hypothetical protein
MLLNNQVRRSRGAGGITTFAQTYSYLRTWLEAGSASMGCLMEHQMHVRILSANEELRDFLWRVERLSNGTGTVSEDDLQQITQRLLNLTPEIGDASRSETLNAGLQMEIAEYVKNLRALQGALERVRSVTRARRAQLESAKRHKDNPQSWINAYYEITH